MNVLFIRFPVNTYSTCEGEDWILFMGVFLCVLKYLAKSENIVRLSFQTLAACWLDICALFIFKSFAVICN